MGWRKKESERERETHTHRRKREREERERGIVTGKGLMCEGDNVVATCSRER